ncbi:MAG: DUF4336 domain-containing protein [Deltaproteobacteria bacterium]|nr:DUF4336 domain-containing protein [Myxococcales bacterium]RZV49649.1 MAG: DUF4336 domain-containing protein [Deltaproteobacteria bacterium]
MPRMEQLADNLWAEAAPQSFFGLHVGTRMTVVRLRDGALLVHSPIAMTPGLKAEVDAIGPVRHIVAPNCYHHLYAGEWKNAHPDARLHAAKGLEKRRKDLAIDSELSSETHPGWGDELATSLLDGTMLNETVFFHRPSRSLIVADVIENFETSAHWPTRAYLKLGGIHGQPGLSLPLRLVFRDKKRARRSIDEILSWDFDRIVLAHGNVIESGGRDILKDAYTWLKG